MNLQPQPEQNLSLPVPLYISDAGVWLKLWKAELEWNASTQPPTFPDRNTLIPPNELERPREL